MKLSWTTSLALAASLVSAISTQHRYIVEFTDAPALSKRSAFGHPSDGFHQVLKDHGFTATPRHDFSFPSFAGVSFQVDHWTDPKKAKRSDVSDHFDEKLTLDYLRSLPEVKSVKKPEVIRLGATHGDFSTGVHATGDDAGDDEIWSSLKETHVDAVHDLGIDGSGIVVAVIDTGVNYSHPALGGGIGEGYKVLGGYNYIDDESSEPLYQQSVDPTSDPMDCYGHGTMVAGVIAGNSSHLRGVAPGASIRAYRVFDCNADTTDEILMAAFQQAREDGVDVVNLSLGSNRSWRELPLARAAADLVRAGIVVVASAGNEGYYGPFSAGNFGAGDDVLSVGSLFADELVTYEVSASSADASFDFEYVALNGTQSALSGDVEFYVLNQTLCTSSSYYNWDLDSSVTRVVIPKGRCDLEDQLYYLYRLDIQHAIFYSSADSDQMYYEDSDYSDYLEVMFSPRSFGEWAQEHQTSDHLVTISFDPSSPALGSDAGLGPSRMDNSSSWGPTYDNKFFPSVSAPGGFIYTSDMNGTYTVTRGTSFAAPYVAGVAALFFDGKQDNSTGAVPRRVNRAREFNSRVMATSNFIRAYDGRRHYTNAQPTIQQGAGMIDALRMVQSRTVILSEPALSLNDTRYRQQAFRIEVYNGHSEAVSYRTTNYPAAAVRCKYSDGEPVDRTYPTQSALQGMAQVFPSEFTLEAGESRNVTAIFYDNGIEAASGVAFGGKLVFAGNNNETVGVPYMGESIPLQTKGHC